MSVNYSSSSLSDPSRRIYRRHPTIQTASLSVNPELEREVIKRAGASLFVLSNAEYESRSKEESKRVESELNALRARAQHQVARCWGQFERVDRDHRRAEENRRITQVLDREMNVFRHQMEEQSRVEEERLKRVYQSLCRPLPASCTHAVAQRYPRVFPIFETREVLSSGQQQAYSIGDDQAYARRRALRARWPHLEEEDKGFDIDKIYERSQRKLRMLNQLLHDIQ